MSKVRILLVDDDKMYREVVGRLLKNMSMDCQIDETDSIAGAKKYLDSNTPDCILLDFYLPDGTGMDFLETVKSGTHLSPPVIMLTGKGSEQLAVSLMKHGADDYLAKDKIGPGDLQRAIEGAMSRSHLRKMNAESHERLLKLSMYDSLTGLPNRSLFFDRLNHFLASAERQGTGFAVLMMDVNLFKEVNDTFGHGAGDKLLQEVARRMDDTIRGFDTVARIGGDEFACILVNAADAEDAVSIAKRLRGAVARPIPLSGTEVSIQLSIGIAMYPDHGETAEELLSNADVGMYTAKRSLSGVHMIAPEKRRAYVSRGLGIATGIEAALEAGQIALLFQPQVEFITRKLVGMEALARWTHPEMGVVSPGEFIPAAERSSAIGPLTSAILDQALAAARRWRDEGINATVSVNLSTRVLDDTSLVARVMDNIEHHQLPPESLSLEITETAIMSEPESATRILRTLSDLGVGVSIDDYGTGNSSLAYLKDFPVGEIKIDRVFVDRIDANDRERMIVESIIHLGHSLGTSVVAEGIENERQWRILKSLGCEIGQGFWIGRPIPAEDIHQWLYDWRQRAADQIIDLRGVQPAGRESILYPKL